MIYLTGQKYSECQLVTVINAAVHLGEPLVNPDSAEYDRLVDYVGARYGSAISIDKAVKYLRLTYKRVPSSLKNIRRALEFNLPVAVNMLHDRAGHHSVCAIGMRGEGAKTEIRLPNIFKEGWDQWLSWKELHRCLTESEHLGSIGGKNRAKNLFVFYPDPFSGRFRETYKNIDPFPKVEYYNV